MRRAAVGALLLILTGCQTPGPAAVPRPGPVRPGRRPPAPPPAAARPFFGPPGRLSAADVGPYMDRQEADLRHTLGGGWRVRRVGDELVLTLPSDTSFVAGTARLANMALRRIAVVAPSLRRFTATRIEVDGFTDTTGTPAYNRHLSQARAEAVADALVMNGVNPARISPRGYGATHLNVPTGPNVYEPANRRVTIRLVPRRQGP